ncbi:unnamed protein product [Arctia plantaginis]|uniref:Uncharacterized protein n=1 Tax=Arctia plantaginis TaxID=874455 RepID=A0A8S1B4P0_ARCPL|nr:unnamed protein product [Arctia plantaginis]
MNSLRANLVRTLTRLLSMHQYAYENEILFQQAVEAVNKIRNKYPVPTEPKIVCLVRSQRERERRRKHPVLMTNCDSPYGFP